jgi:membrane protein
VRVTRNRRSRARAGSPQRRRFRASTEPARGWRGRWRGFRAFASDFLDDRPFVLAAATSYYTLLSLAPLLLIVISVAGLVFERGAVEGRIVEEMGYLVGDDGAAAMEIVIRNSRGPGSGFSLAVGIVTLLIGASTVFQQLHVALNEIWEVEAKPGRGTVLAFVRQRLLSFAMVLAIGFLLLVSLVLSAGLSALANWLQGSREELALVGQAVNAVASLGVITILFAMLFKFLPDAEIRWRHVWAGAALTAVLFTVGKQLIGAYLGHASVGSSFGAAGSIVVLTVWVYYASLILFLGAKITRVHADRAGAPRVPAEYAVERERDPSP